MINTEGLCRVRRVELIGVGEGRERGAGSVSKAVFWEVEGVTSQEVNERSLGPDPVRSHWGQFCFCCQHNELIWLGAESCPHSWGLEEEAEQNSRLCKQPEAGGTQWQVEGEKTVRRCALQTKVPWGSLFQMVGKELGYPHLQLRTYEQVSDKM